MKHTLADRVASEVLDEIDRLVASGVVKERAIEDGRYSIFKYNDAPKIEGIARVARGLIIARTPAPCFVNYPMEKFDEVAPYCDDTEEYHRAVSAALPPRVTLQPKHDGTCIHAVCHGGRPLVSTFVATDSPQARRAKKLLANAAWDEGVTYGFELIDAADAKVQEKRVADGLYLFYGCDASGRFLTREELARAASRLGTPLVKQQSASRETVMTQLRRMDGAAAVEDVMEGMVAILDDARRVKIKSRVYLELSSQIKPTPRWLKAIVSKSATLDAVHDAVEGFDGCLDLPVRARRLLVDLLLKTRATIEEVEASACDSFQSVNAQPAALRPFLFDKLKGRFEPESDEGLFRIVRAIASKMD